MTTDRAAAKDAVRREALARRDAIPMTRRIEASLALADHAAALGVGPGDVVSAYWPIRSEIDPRPLLFALHEAGCRMALPAIVDGALEFRELTRTGELEPAGFGTSAPRAGAPVLDPAIVLAPLAAFDAAGNRVGYGAGHYDRALATMRERGLHPLVVGLAHAAQEVGAVPAEPHDVPLDGVLCEHGPRAISARMNAIRSGSAS